MINEMSARLSRHRSHSVLFRLILTFSIVMLPIAATGCYVNSQGYAMLTEQTTFSMSQQMEFNIDALESQLSLANTQVYQLMNEKESRRYACILDDAMSYEYVYRTNILLERMYTIYLSNDFVESIELLLPRLEKRLLVSGGSKDTSVSSLSADYYASMHALAQNWSMQAQYDSSQLCCIYQLPSALAMSTDTMPWMISRIVYSTSAIESYLTGILPDIPTECVLMTKSGDVIVGAQPVDDEILSRLNDALSQKPTGKRRILDVSNGESLIMGCYSSLMDAYYVVYANRSDVYTNQWLYRNTLALLIMFSVLALCVYAFMVCRQVHAPLRQLDQAFERLACGEMDFSVPENMRGEFGSLMRAFNQMLTRLRATVSQLYEQRILMQQAQLKQMQAQINPHFLYNSFFILNNMIAMEDYEAASMFSQRLGEYFRYVTRDARDIVSLEDEYAHVHSYIDVQLIRFGRRISASLPELDAGVKHIMIPRLSLQPIVENAFVHSLEHYSGRGMLIIRIDAEDDGVVIEVENNGAADIKDSIERLQSELDIDDPHAERSGLKNVHQRLKMIQGQGLTIRFEEPDRIIVRMCIRSEITEGR